VALLDPLAGWLTFASLLVLLGAATMRWVLLPNADLSDADRGELEIRTGRTGLGACVCLFAGLGLVLVRQTIDFRDPFVPLSEDLALLVGGTAWGQAWVAAAVLTAVATLAFWLTRRGRPWAWWLATPVTLVLAFFPGSTGHAAAARAEHPLALAIDALHVISAGAWAGGLTVMLLVAGAASSTGRRDGAAVLRALVPCFTPLALAAAAVVVLSGLYATWLHGIDVGRLLTSDYGRTLMLKLVAVAAAMLAGALNWRRQHPLLLTSGDAGPLRRTAMIEAVLVQLVLLFTAMLVRTSPPT
jgi:putative copper export protein